MGGATAGSTEEATSALEEYGNQLRAQFDPLFGAVDAANQLAAANQKVVEAEVAVAEAVRDHGAGSAEATAAQQALTLAQLDASAAALGQQGALITLSEAVGNGTVSLQGAKEKLAEWVAQGLITQTTADTTAAAFEGVTGAALEVPTSVSTSVSAPGAIGARIEIQGVGAALNDIDGDNATVTVHANYVYRVRRCSRRSRGAAWHSPPAGGPVFGGRLYRWLSRAGPSCWRWPAAPT